jgi:segregation and condensation protein B
MDTEAEAEAEAEPVATDPITLELQAAIGEGVSPRLLAILESLLYASDRPLRVQQIQKLLGERSGKRVRQALRALEEARRDSGIVLMEVDAGFQLRTHPENARWVRRLEEVKPIRMSRAALEVLSVIAYRQPVTRVEIDQIRGVDCGAVLKQLQERDLVKIVGRREEVGRPYLYGTTHEFLTFFSLKGLGELPPLREVNELVEIEKQAQAATPVPGGPLPVPPERAPAEISAEEIAPGTGEDEGFDEEDAELTAALEEAASAAAGADRIHRGLRKAARNEAEATATAGAAPPPREVGGLADFLAKRQAKRVAPPPDLDLSDVEAEEPGPPAPPAAPGRPAPEPEPADADADADAPDLDAGEDLDAAVAELDDVLGDD